MADYFDLHNGKSPWNWQFVPLKRVTSHGLSPWSDTLFTRWGSFGSSDRTTSKQLIYCLLWNFNIYTAEQIFACITAWKHLFCVFLFCFIFRDLSVNRLGLYSVFTHSEDNRLEADNRSWRISRRILPGDSPAVPFFCSLRCDFLLFLWVTLFRL